MTDEQFGFLLGRLDEIGSALRDIDKTLRVAIDHPLRVVIVAGPVRGGLV